MKKTLKIFTIFVFIAIVGLGFKNPTVVHAQSATGNFGYVIDNKDKILMENPWGGTGNTTQIGQSTCPSDSILVGFNLYYQGTIYEKEGSLYCQKVALNLGDIVPYTRQLIEHPWGGTNDSTLISESICPTNTIMVGFNLWNGGQNVSTNGAAYCREVLSAKPLSLNQDQTISIGSVEKKDSPVVENPTVIPGSPAANAGQISDSSCPAGYAVVGFNLLNMGENISNIGSLYCRKLTFAPVSSFDFTMSNGGDRIINAGDPVINTITATLKTGSTNNVTLSLDSVKNSSGIEVLGNNPAGFSAGATIFTKKTVLPTETTNMSFNSLSSTPPGDYTVTVSGKYTKAVTGGGGNPSNVAYSCRIIFGNSGADLVKAGGYYFGCSDQSGFNPRTDWINSNGSTPYTRICIDNETIGPGGGCGYSSTDDDRPANGSFSGFKLTAEGLNLLKDYRVEIANENCNGVGSYTINGNLDNPGAGFNCTSVASGTKSSGLDIIHATTYKVKVVDFGLATVIPADCSVNPQYIKSSWNPYPGATAYNVYRTRTDTGQQTIIPINSPTLGADGKISYSDTAFTNKGLLFSYKVGAIVGGVVKLISNDSFIYSPDCAPPATPLVPVINLYAKETTDNSINLDAYTINTATPTGSPTLTLLEDETFDLRWITNLTSDWTCKQDTTIPGNAKNNSIWNYGSTLNGSGSGNSVKFISTGLYKLKLLCTSGAGTQSYSNEITIQVNPTVKPPVYNLNINQSGNQCNATSLFVKLNWDVIPTATSYDIVRTGGAGPVSINVTTNSYTYNSSAFTQNTSYTYTVTAKTGATSLASSPSKTMTSPMAVCPPPPALKLFIKNSSSATDINSYTLNTALTNANTIAYVNRGDSFDLRWAGTAPTDFTCTQYTLRPNYSLDNTIWPYGTSIDGSAAGLSTASTNTPGNTSPYQLKINCTNGASSVSSNLVLVYIVDPTNYGLTVSPNAGCSDLDLSIVSSWNAVPGATSYRLTRSGSIISVIPATDISSAGNYQYTEIMPSFTKGASYSYTVAALVGGIWQPPSAAVPITAPNTTSCPATLKLEIKKSTGSNSSYLTSQVDVFKGETFDLRWSSVGATGTYDCTTNNKIVKKSSGADVSTLWTGWGGSTDGVKASLPTSASQYVVDKYTFSMKCIGQSGQGDMVSNSVILNITPPNVIPTPTATPTCTNCGGLPPPLPHDPLIKLYLNTKAFVDSVDTTQAVNKTDATAPIFKVKRGQKFSIRWEDNGSLTGYQCERHTLDPDRATTNLWNWNSGGTPDGQDDNWQTDLDGIRTGIYRFYLTCDDNDPTDGVGEPAQSNTVKLNVYTADIKEK